jgi:hypothetical protein
MAIIDVVTEPTLVILDHILIYHLRPLLHSLGFLNTSESDSNNYRPLVDLVGDYLTAPSLPHSNVILNNNVNYEQFRYFLSTVEAFDLHTEVADSKNVVFTNNESKISTRKDELKQLRAHFSRKLLNEYDTMEYPKSRFPPPINHHTYYGNAVTSLGEPLVFVLQNVRVTFHYNHKHLSLAVHLNPCADHTQHLMERLRDFPVRWQSNTFVKDPDSHYKGKWFLIDCGMFTDQMTNYMKQIEQANKANRAKHSQSFSEVKFICFHPLLESNPSTDPLIKSRCVLFSYTL